MMITIAITITSMITAISINVIIIIIYDIIWYRHAQWHAGPLGPAGHAQWHAGGATCGKNIYIYIYI